MCVGKYRGKDGKLHWNDGECPSVKKRKMKQTSLIGYNIVIKRDLFNEVEGFRDVLLEDIDISVRLMDENTKMKYITNRFVITSERKYLKMGILRTLRYYWELFLYKLYQNEKHFRFITYIDIR